LLCGNTKASSVTEYYELTDLKRTAYETSLC
jgi:hypothetical protein